MITAVSVIKWLCLYEFTIWGRDLVSVVLVIELFFFKKIYENLVGTLKTVRNIEVAVLERCLFREVRRTVYACQQIGFYGNVNIHITATLHLLKCYQVNLRKQKLLQLFWSHSTLHLGGPWLTWEVPLCEACHPSQLRRVRGTLQHISVWGYTLYPGITRVKFVRLLRPSDLGPVYMAVGDPRYVR